ncbi:hypothetical protein AgCh_037292 [Apium graveolens]
MGAPLNKSRYTTEELLPVMQPQEDGVRGQRPPRVCLDGRPPPVVNECPHWGCGVNSGVCFGSSVSVVNGYPRWETSEHPALCTQKLAITCPGDALSVKSQSRGRALGLCGWTSSADIPKASRRRFLVEGGANQDLHLGGKMSQYCDESSYDGESSEEGSEQGYDEPYVPTPVDHPTPNVDGQPPVLISNADLLEQLYRMGDALNGFDSRLSTVEWCKTRRGLRRNRSALAVANPERDADHGYVTPHSSMRVPLNPTENQERHRDHERTPPRGSMDRYGRDYGSDRWRRPQWRGRGEDRGRYLDGYHRDNYRGYKDTRMYDRGGRNNYAGDDCNALQTRGISLGVTR